MEIQHIKADERGKFTATNVYIKESEKSQTLPPKN